MIQGNCTQTEARLHTRKKLKLITTEKFFVNPGSVPEPYIVPLQVQIETIKVISLEG